ncbi:MAG: YncE family protein, partial [Proteobacteria bacterium]|nr:YncE family protein [Pseudomonadota bacterium]
MFALSMLWALAAGCNSDDESTDTAEALANRAYVISENSDDLFIVDLRTMTEVAKIDTNIGVGINRNHMAVLSQDGSKLYLTATHHSAIAVVDTIELEVAKIIPIGAHPSHANACFACGPNSRDELWVVNEDSGSVSVIDMERDQVVDTVAHPSMMVPHFVRFANGSAYVPSIGGNQITVIDLASRQVSDVLLADGATAAGLCSADPCGFADAQIDGNGILSAAHIESGNVLLYDTRTKQRLSDLDIGNQPWAVFVDPLSNEFDTHLMPNWGDSTVSIIDRVSRTEIARSTAGDIESYGVNYSPLAPGQAFVLNRMQERVSVVDRTNGSLIGSINVGGTTETASTTADGRYLVTAGADVLVIWPFLGSDGPIGQQAGVFAPEGSV